MVSINPLKVADRGGGQRGQPPPLIFEIYVVKGPLVANFYVILAPQRGPRRPSEALAGLE